MEASRTLLASIRNRQATVGAAVGSGMTAKAAEDGGADFLLVLNAGHFRIQGCSSVAALMPYANANELTWRIAEQHVLPRVRRTPIFLGVCAQDPELNIPVLFKLVKDANIAGITNFPSVGFHDGIYREALEESELGFQQEVLMIKRAHEAELLTVAFVFSPLEACAMSEAGANILCLDLGFAEWRDRTEEQHEQAMDEALGRIRKMITAVKAINPNPYVVVLGGPIGTPRDSARLYQHADVQGYVGGSAVERFPAAPLISQTVREFKATAAKGAQEDRLGGMIGVGNAMRSVFETLKRVADSDVPVLILGESGTGKELAARELHRLSARHGQPMVSCNCGALTETLAMSELFGHEKGAFTGALTQHLGRFEQAHGGTLLMDEITELSPSVQASLLRVLQERELVRVGGTNNVAVDVRLVSATNRDVADLIRGGQFRLDLFYRINTVVLRIPPLRERSEDIPVLVREMTHEFSQKCGYPTPELPRSVLDDLMRHPWPGNIRELRNAVERCVILGRGERFRSEWLNDMYQMANAFTPPSESTGHGVGALRLARKRLQEVLHRHDGNKTKAASELGVTRKTIYAWLRSAENLADDS